jgi:hypothetical protein
MGVIGRQKRTFVDSVDISKILIAANIHEALTHYIDFIGVTKNAPAGTYESKGRTFESCRAHLKQKTYGPHENTKIPKR